MNIAFATAQSLRGSTNVGRILPLAGELQKKGHEVHILALTTPAGPPMAEGSPLPREKHTPTIHTAGIEPFQRTPDGKKRLRGMRLLLNMLSTALRTARILFRLKPDVIIISKPLPANVAGVWLYAKLNRKCRIVLDTDDFELTANHLSSVYQRAVIHWSERTAATIANIIITASPFLADHFKQLTQNAKPVEVIATGINDKEILSEAPEATKGSSSRSFLAYFGSISVSSGHRVDVLPEILEKVLSATPNAHLMLAGDGDDVASLKKEFEHRNISAHVTWHGRFNLNEIKGLLSHQAIVLDPIDDSISNRAKSSFRVILACLLGHPVVTSNIGIRADLVPEQFHDRFFAEPGDANSYVEKIRTLLSQGLTSNEREQLHTHAQLFTWEKLGDQFEKVIVSP